MPNISKKNILPQSILNIQGLRGLAALMVLIAHVSLYENRIGSGALLPNWMFELGSGGVDLFFVISGYVMVAISGFGPSGFKPASQFFLRRITRIYPLYWAFTLLVIVIVSFVPQALQREGGASNIDYIKSFFLIPDINAAPLVGQGWTLVHEMYFYLVFTFVVLVKKELRVYFICFWLIFLITYNWLVPAPQGPIWRTSTSSLTFEFIMGCVAAYLHKIGYVKYGILSLMAGVLTLCFNPEHLDSDRFLWYGIPFFLIVYGAVATELVRTWIAPAWLRFTGDISYSIYLSHILVIAACAKIWKLFNNVGIFDNIVMIIIMLATSWLSGLAVFKLVEYPIMKRIKFMIQKQGW